MRRDQDGIITYVNSAAADVFGADHPLQPGSAMELPLIEVEGLGCLRTESFDDDAQAMDFQDLHIETAQGPRWFSRIDIPVRDTVTDRQLVQSVLRDVTERRLIEEELLAARHAAESSNEAKSRFLATVSHEIRTPLNGVLGMAALLRDTRLTKEQSAYIEALETSGETLLLLIDEVLDFSKVEAGKLDIRATPVRVGALAENVVELLAQGPCQAARGRRFRRSGPSGGSHPGCHQGAADPVQSDRQRHQVHRRWRGGGGTGGTAKSRRRQLP
ncbi:histidine kinase dimerization/phospho-acceptor domain-containing protein [Roseibium salinum]|uniref:histidine kinase dimerization/phospho-acceptor domain-containing protein n=1 Tax=Roseibium salinum TaxID=1604349 RepID=UPI003623E929